MRQAAFTALALFGISASAHAQSAFDGTWRFAPEATHVSGIQYDIALEDGVFTCRWCKPVWSVPADGDFHPVAGQSRYDAASVQIVDGSTAVFTRKKNGRAFYRAVDVISEDQNYMAFSFTEISGSGKVETGNGLWRRITPKPAGAHPVTGRWRELWVKARSNDELSFTIVTNGDHVRIEYSPEEIVNAQFGGHAVKIGGDSSSTMASLTRQGEDAFVETDYRDGEVVTVVTSKLLDPSTMEIIVENRRDGSRSLYSAHKQ